MNFKESWMNSSWQGMQEGAKKLVADNAQILLTAGGVVGTVGTGLLAWRGGYRAAEIIRDEELKHIHENGTEETLSNATMGLSKAQRVALVWTYAAPPMLIGGATIGSIIMSHRMSASKAAALAAAYGLSQKQFEEYREKVAEKLTGPKNQAIKDELAQDRVNKTSGSSQIIVVEGQVLCFDQPTGRYFQSTMDDIKKAEIFTNQEILHHDVASATFFYEQLGLPPTTWSEDVGWNTDNMVEIEYSTVLAYNDRPCIAINFKNMPSPNYLRQY